MGARLDHPKVDYDVFGYKIIEEIVVFYPGNHLFIPFK